MTLAVAAALLATALGLVGVRTATPAARWLAWCTALAFAVAIAALPANAWRERDASPTAAAWRSDATARGTALLAAAAAAGPRAADVEIAWREPAAGATNGAFGAVVRTPAPLPFEPADLQVHALGDAERDRPLALRVAGVATDAPFAAEVRVARGEQIVWRAPVTLSAAPVDVAFTPADAGVHRIELAVEAGGHAVRARGEFDVAEPAPVLVVEPSGLAVAALRAQGVHVVAAAEWPADLAPFRAVVLGAPLPTAAQGALAAAVRDGLGAFVLAPAFGGEGEPVRTLLPLLPAPQLPGKPGDDAAATNDTPPANEPPPSATPPPAKPPDTPPQGDTAGATPPSAEPIEVDKRAIAMVLVVDRSGSMGTILANGATKMSYAKTSALRTAAALGDGDQVGVVTFGDKGLGRVELPMTKATDSEAVKTGIAKLRHGNEATFLLSGLRAAYDLLRPIDAAVKHVVVISDGEFRVEEGPALGALVHDARESDKTTLSLISIVEGSAVSSFVLLAERLRKEGGGEFIQASDPDKVPTLVSAEVTRSLSRVGRKPRTPGGDSQAPPPREPEPRPEPPQPEPPKPEPKPEPPRPTPAAARVPVRAVADSTLLDPQPSDAWPSLGSATAGTAPFDASVLLVAGDAGWPLLAFGNRGLGRVGAFAADLCGDAGAEFRAEAAFPARLAQWVQSVLPVRPEREPRALLQPAVVEPPALTPREAEALAAVATLPPQALADGAHMPPEPSPQLVRETAPTVPAAAPWLLALLVLLAAGERFFATRALRA